jgi:hypothetical protein
VRYLNPSVILQQRQTAIRRSIVEDKIPIDNAVVVLEKERQHAGVVPA